MLTSSLADTVMIHLAEQVAPGIDVLFLDTGYHFVETIGTRDAVAAVHDVNLITLTPAQTVAEQDATWGKDLFSVNPDQCCALRKTEPLNEALAGYTAWASGVRRADSVARAKTPIVSWDLRRKIIKIAPIATWTDDDVADYIERQQPDGQPAARGRLPLDRLRALHLPGHRRRSAGRTLGRTGEDGMRNPPMSIDTDARGTGSGDRRRDRPAAPPCGSPGCPRRASRPSPTRWPIGSPPTASASRSSTVTPSDRICRPGSASAGPIATSTSPGSAGWPDCSPVTASSSWCR